MNRDERHAEELTRFAYWARRTAAERGLGMNQLLRRSALGQGTFFAAMDGRGNPTSRTLSSIATALGVRLCDLLDPLPDDDDPED